MTQRVVDSRYASSTVLTPIGRANYFFPCGH